MSQLHKISGCDNASRQADVVFIHGLGGDAFTTWRHGRDDSTSWPHWLGGEFPDVGVWSLDYAASPTRWTRVCGWLSRRWRDAGHTMALPDRALQVLDQMSQQGLGQRPLLFIGHSLGGLLVKQLLRKAADAGEPRKRQVAAQTRAVLFLATPHAGAELASLANAFRTIFGATVSIEELRAHDAHLRDLFDWYRRHSAELGIQTATYYELRPVKGVLPIVSPTSAHPGVGPDPVGLDEDHLSIAKPRARDAQVCAAARDLLRDQVLAPRPATATQWPLSPAPALPPRVVVQLESGDRRRVPCELPPPAEKHFGRQRELQQLTDRLRAGKNSAVVGPAGLGKTALAAEAVRAVVGDTPATLAASPFPDGVVFLDLYTFRGQAEAAWNNLANALEGPGFMETSRAGERAREACRGRRLLVILEGGEEADGQDRRASIPELFRVFSPQNRWLLLTRLSIQAAPTETVELKAALPPGDAADLLDSITGGRVTGSVRDRVLALMEGHPLALTWAGNELAREEEEPGRLADDWQASRLPRLSDPKQAEHTLAWLFHRSVRGLPETARQALAAAGLLARAPFPLGAIHEALDSRDSGVDASREALKTLVRHGLLRRSGEADHWEFTHVLGYRFARQETGSEPALRDRLAQWLSGHLRTALAETVGQENAPDLNRLVAHGAALLRADDDQRLWMPLASGLLYDACDRFEALGRLDVMRLALGGVGDWLARFPPDKACQPDWLRERSVLLNRQGDVLRDQGDLAGALAAYRESLAVSRRLAEADPSHAGWQRDLSVSQEKIGDVLRDQGDLAGALAAYRESLAGSRRLAEADPSHAGWQRDLSFILTRVAEFHERQGHRKEALPFAEESQMIDERLAALDPSNVIWQSDVAVTRALVARLRG